MNVINCDPEITYVEHNKDVEFSGIKIFHHTVNWNYIGRNLSNEQIFIGKDDFGHLYKYISKTCYCTRPTVQVGSGLNVREALAASYEN